MAPQIHAQKSAVRFGGIAEDYLEIHEFLDSSKEAVADVRHRALTHNSWFVTKVMERIFGSTLENSDGKSIPVRDIAQWHVMEDLGGSFPTAQDYLMNLKFEPWMNNGQEGKVPPSHEGLPPFDMRLLDPQPRKKGAADEVTKDSSGKGLENDPQSQHIPPSFSEPFFAEDDFPARGCGGGGRLD